MKIRSALGAWTLWFGVSPMLIIGSAQASHEQIQLFLPDQVAARKIALDHQNPGHMFATSDTYSPCLYQSFDAGDQWSAVSGAVLAAGQCRLIVIDPANSAHLILATALGLYSSRDGAANWDNVASPRDFNFVEFNPVQKDVVFAATSDRQLLKSSDSGETWQQVGLSPVEEISDIAFSEANPDNLYLFSGTALFNSRDAGLTWYVDAGRKSIMAMGSSAVADISARGAANSTFTVMAPLSAVFDIGNSGPEPAINVRVVIQLPTVMPAPNSVRVDLDPLHTSCALGTFQAVCDIPRIDPGQIAYVSLNFPMVSPLPANTVTISATAVSDTADSDSQNNTATVTSTYGVIAAATPSANSGSGTNGNNGATEPSGGGQLGASFEMLLLLTACARVVRRFATVPSL